MARTSFKKVLSEPFVTRMIIGHDNVWHAMRSEAVSLFVKPLVCLYSLSVLLIDNVRWLLDPDLMKTERLYIVTQRSCFLSSSTLTYFSAE